MTVCLWHVRVARESAAWTTRMAEDFLENADTRSTVYKEFPRNTAHCEQSSSTELLGVEALQFATALVRWFANF